MKLKNIMTESVDRGDTLESALEHLASFPEQYGTSRDVLNRLSGWFKRSDPKIAEYLEQILMHTKTADMKPGPRL